MIIRPTCSAMNSDLKAACPKYGFSPEKVDSFCAFAPKLAHNGGGFKSTSATVLLRTKKTRGCVSRTTILTMVNKLGLSAEKGVIAAHIAAKIMHNSFLSHLRMRRRL